MAWKMAYAMHIVVDVLWYIVLPPFGFCCMCNDITSYCQQFGLLCFVIF